MARIEKHAGGFRTVIEAGKDADGKRIRRSRVFKTFEEAKNHLRNAAPTEGRGTGSENLGDAMHNWIVYREGMGVTSGKTAERHYIIARNLAHATGNVKLHRLTSPIVETALKRLAESGGTSQRPLASQTIRHHRALLSQFCKRQVAQGVMARNPVEGTELPKQLKTRVAAPSMQNAIALVDLAANSSRCNGQLRMVVLTALHTGARRGEILALKWSSVDFERGTISIAASVEQTNAHGLRIKPPKTSAGHRTLPCTTTLMEALRAHKVLQAEQRIKAGSAWADNDFVFCNELGEVMNPSEVSRQTGRLARQAGFPPNVAPLHGLRHLHGTQLNSAGLDAKTIQKRLGHEDIAITLQFYVHADDENARKAADVFEGLGG